MTNKKWEHSPHARASRLPVPLTQVQNALIRKRAIKLCQGAHDERSKKIANKLAMAWLGCGCADLVATGKPSGAAGAGAGGGSG